MNIKIKCKTLRALIYHCALSVWEISNTAGEVANFAEDLKRRKYTSPERDYIIEPIGIKNRILCILVQNCESCDAVTATDPNNDYEGSLSES